MLTETKRTDLFCEYYAKWITVYKKGAIRKVTMDKYLMTQKWLVKLVPNLRVCDMNRIAYQQLLNDYAEFHERQTTMDFHHQLKGAILDAVDEGLIERDPTRKAIIKGKPPVAKKIKYLNQFELHTLLISLDLKDMPTQSPMLIAKAAFALFEKRYDWRNPIRSVTIQAINLVPQDTPRQVDLFMNIEKIEKAERLDQCIETIRQRFGKNSIRNGILFQNLRMPSEKPEITMPTGVLC